MSCSTRTNCGMNRESVRAIRHDRGERQGGGDPGSMLDKVIEPFFTTKDVGRDRDLGLQNGMV